jgi:hypothetical protein
MVASNEYQKVVQTVLSWPPEDRASLIQLLLDGMKSHATATAQKLQLSDFVGIARGSGAAPDDAQVKQWIDEHRMEKYGR